MKDNPQAQAENTPATATPATGADNDQQPNLENVSLTDLDAVQTTAAEKVRTGDTEAAGGGEQGQETPATETPAVEQPTSEQPASEQPTTETPAAAEPEKKEPAAEPTQAQAEPTEPEAPERFRFKDSTDRAVAAIKKARPDLSWAEAEKLVVGEKPAAEAPAVDPIAAATTQIATLDDEIKALEAQINPAEEDEILSTKAMREATVKLAEKRAEKVRQEIKLEDAQRDREAQIAQNRNARMSAREESKQRALAEFPDAANADTPLGKAIAAEFEALRDPNHPDHDILYADSAPEIVTERLAKKLGIAPKAKTPTAKPAQVTPAEPKKAQPVSGAKTSVPENPNTPQEDKKSFEYLREKGSLAELDDAAGANQGIAAAVR